MKKYLDQLYMTYDDSKLRLHYTICTIGYSSFANEYKLSVLYDMEEWLLSINSNNKKFNILKQESLKKITYLIWVDICLSFSFRGVKVWNAYNMSDLYVGNNKWNDFKVFVYSIFKIGTNYRQKIRSIIND